MILQRLADGGLEFTELRLDGLTLVRRHGADLAALGAPEHTVFAGAATAEAGLDAALQVERAAGAVVRHTPPAEAVAFYQDAFFPLLVKAYGAKVRPKPLALLAEAEDRYGAPFPPELRALFTFVETHEVGRVRFGEWQGLGDLLAPVKAGQNLLAEHIALDRKNYLGTATLEILCSLVCIGQAGNGDVYFAFVDAQRPEACEVYLWDHEARSLEVFADSIATLARLNWVYEVHGGAVEVDPDADVLAEVAAAMAPLAKHIAPSWHYRDLVKTSGHTVGYAPANGVPFLYFRSLWIDTLVSGRAGTLDQVAGQAKRRFFSQLDTWHRGVPPERIFSSPRWLKSSASVYWLFYYTFFDHLDLLGRACAELAHAEGRFARDAAALFGALHAALTATPPAKASKAAKAAAKAASEAGASEAGTSEASAGAKAKKPAAAKATLGKIANVAGLRKAFAAAETEAARTERLAAEAAAAEAARAVDRAHGEALLRAELGVHDGFEAVAPSAAVQARLLAGAAELMGRPEAVERVFAHLVAHDADLAEGLRRFAVLADAGDYRAHPSAQAWLRTHGHPGLRVLAQARGLRLAVQALTPTEPPAAPSRPTLTDSTFDTLPQAAPRRALARLADPRRPLGDAAEQAADRAALAQVDAVLARRRGFSLTWLVERLYREALADRVGLPVDLAVVRDALRFVQSDRELTDHLQRVALHLLARHAPAAEVAATALRLVSWALPGTREAARALASALGLPGAPRVFDGLAATVLWATEGLEGVCSALADDWVLPLNHLVARAGEALGAETGPEADARRTRLGEAAVAAFEARYFHFTLGQGYYSGRYGELIDDARAIAALPGPAVDAFIHRMINHPGPLLRPVLSETEHQNRARAVGPMTPPRSVPAAEVVPFAEPPFALGGAVHGLACLGEVVVAGGNQRSAIFDAAGASVSLPPEVVAGWCYDVDLDPRGRWLALGYHGCHVVILDATHHTLVHRLKLGGVPSGVRKLKFSPDGAFLATASDDKSLRVIDTATWETVQHHDEPYDVNGVAWIDQHTLAFVTDHHLGVLARATEADRSPEPRRIDVGGGADVVCVPAPGPAGERGEVRLVVGSQKHGVAVVHPSTLKIEHKVPLKNLARARLNLSRDGLWLACYDGPDEGLWWVSLHDRGAPRRLFSEALFALDLHPQTGALVAGGKAGVVHRISPLGEVLPPDALTHTAAIVQLAPAPGPDGATDPAAFLALDAHGAVLRWSVAQGTATRPWPTTPHDDAQACAVLPDGALAVAAFKAVSVTEAGPGGAERFRVALNRCEAVVAGGDAVVVGDGPRLTWLDTRTGAVLVSAPAGVKSSWVAHLVGLGADRFLALGYDDPKVARWAVGAQAPVSDSSEDVAVFDQRGADGRYARSYGLCRSDDGTRLYVAHWNECVEVIDTATLRVLGLIDVRQAYGVLAVDNAGPEAQWLVAAVGSFVDVYSAADGVHQARALLPAEVKALRVVGPREAIAGLNTGALYRLRW